MRKLKLAACGAVAAWAWTSVAYYLVSVDVGSLADPLHPTRLVYYILAVAAPALTFFPLGALMGARRYGPEATMAWAGLIFLGTFVSPGTAGMSVALVFIGLLFVAASAVFLPIGYWLGNTFLTLRAHRRDTGRARREAYLVGLFVALSAAMNMGGFFSWLNALLLTLMLVLVETFALAYKPGAQLD